jgi:hypothetical protein
MRVVWHRPRAITTPFTHKGDGADAGVVFAKILLAREDSCTASAIDQE